MPAIRTSASVVTAAILACIAGDALAGGATHPAPAIVEAKAYGPGFPTMDSPAREPNGDMATITKLSLGCLGAGSVATLAALGSAAENTINIIGGGIVPVAHPVVLYLGLGGVVFATYCSIGHAVTPLVLHYFGTPEPPAPAPARPSTCRDCRDARPSAIEPAAIVPATMTVAPTAARPASPQRRRGPAEVTGVAALRAAVR